MTAKEFLRRFFSLGIRINHKKEELDKLRRTATAISGTDYSVERVQLSHSGAAPFEDKVAQLADLQSALSMEIVSYEVEKARIVDAINDIPNDNYAQLLYQRYVERKPFADIAKSIGYSSQHIRRMHGYALQAFQKCHSEMLLENRPMFK